MLSFYQEYGSKWSLISRLIGNRNEHMVKNRFNALVVKWNKQHPNKKGKFKVQFLIEELKKSGVGEEPRTVQREKK